MNHWAVSPDHCSTRTIEWMKSDLLEVIREDEPAGTDVRRPLPTPFFYCADLTIFVHYYNIFKNLLKYLKL